VSDILVTSEYGSYSWRDFVDIKIICENYYTKSPLYLTLRYTPEELFRASREGEIFR
jgi:hypothetical protein